MRQRRGGGTRAFIVLNHPIGHALFFLGQRGQDFFGLFGRSDVKARRFLAAGQGEQNGAFQQNAQLLGCQPDDFLLVPALLQLLAAVHQQLGVVGLLSGLPRLLFHTDSQGAGQHAGGQHNQKRDRIIRVGRLQGEPRNREKEVKGENAQ